MQRITLEIIGLIKSGGSSHQHLRHVEKQSPVTVLAGIGQTAPAEGCPKAHLVKLFAPTHQTANNISQTVTIGKLSKTEGEKIIFFQAEEGIRYWSVTGVQTCALPI